MQATQIRDKRTAEEIAQRISSAKLNAVFVLVYYWGGKSFFRTDYAPLVDNNAKGDDLFLYFIEECHKRGIKVYARLSNGMEGAMGNDGMLTRYPAWQIENIRGEKMRWFDLGKREVREFQIQLLSDLLKNYPVDGVQLDYIRFPSLDYCYCEECRMNFKSSYEIDPIDLFSALPASFNISSTPFVKPTQARVIARFENGVPAITLRESNPGWLLLFNWQIDGDSLPFFLQSIRKATEEGEGIYIPLSRRGLAYEEKGFGEIIKALKTAGIAWKMVGAFADVYPENSILLLPAVEKMEDSLSAELENFLSKGGKIIVTLGKGGIREGRGYERLLGVEEKGRSMSGRHLINVVEEHHLIPIFPGSPQQRRHLLAQWIDFRKGLVTSFVEEIYNKTKEINSSLLLSAAVFYNKSAAEGVLQDWYNWLNRGIVDFIAPMAYVNDDRLTSALREWKSYDPDFERIVPGLSIYQVKNGKEVPKDREAVKRQIRIIKEGGARGFILFSLPFLTEDLARELSRL